MGSYKRCLLLSLLALLTFTLSGCSGGRMLKTLPSQSELSDIKGWSPAAVERKFGSEYTETFDSNGNKVWSYKKKSDSNGWMTLGVPVLVDVVTINFHNNKVSSYKYNPGILNGGLPGMGALSSAMGSMGMGSKKSSDAPANSKSSSPPTEAKAPSAKTPPPAEVKASAAKLSPPEKSEAKVTIADSKRFDQCSLKGAKKRLCANAQKNGFKVEESKDGKITLIREGVKITTSFKQSGKNVLVGLSSTGRFTDTTLSKDLCRMLESCN